MSKDARRLTSAIAWEQSPIDDYVNDVRIVWEPHDIERSMLDIWLRVAQYASALGETVRRGRYDEAKARLGWVAIWMLTFVAKGQSDLKGFDALFRMNRPLSEMLWRKYPNCCPACFTRKIARSSGESWEGNFKECDCILALAETEERNQRLSPERKKEVARERRAYADHWMKERFDYGEISLRELEARFARMFRRNIFALDLDHVTFHFLEEVGEVVEAITSLYTYAVPKDTAPELLTEQWEAKCLELEEEVADAFSWLFAVSSKFRDVFGMFDSYVGGKSRYAETMNIASHLQTRHMRHSDHVMICHDCKKPVCTCKIKLISDERSVGELTGASSAQKGGSQKSGL